MTSTPSATLNVSDTQPKETVVKKTRKPVHNCHSCLLNLGDHCWLYEYPRGQWTRKKRCPAFENEDVYAKFREWETKPHVKTAKDLRRDVFRRTKKSEEHHNHFGGGTLP